ncbi:MAG: hypothetical protein ACNA7M_08255 [Roseovarius sp.]
MAYSYIAEQECWIVCSRLEDIPVAFVHMEEGQHMSTSHPLVEVFLNRDEAVDRAKEIDPDWIDTDAQPEPALGDV